MIHILRGDDSKQHTMQITPPAGIDLTGYRLRFTCGEIVREFPVDATAAFDFPRGWTSRQAVGRQLAKWQLVAPDGKVTTSTNTFPIFLTDVVQDVTGSQSGEISFVIDSNFPLEGMNFDKNATSRQLLNFLAEVVQRLGGTVSNNQ